MNNHLEDQKDYIEIRKNNKENKRKKNVKLENLYINCTYALQTIS